ncbi:GYDIA family GHMP kinase [Muriicola soli]|uniref:GHMP kinase n=1 Tax=Muriicola soli TaxID=2507538 RepID=A0A411EBV3_9FLAO|nr:GYDIA family GHMP kinase [Muriicola soli]QBA65013.1 GHMP kinase [Muriicola soli]
MKETFRSNGKLLLTGEYAVLDGALALGLPTLLGQELSIESWSEKGLHWKSIDVDQNVWFETTFTEAELKPDASFTRGSDIRNTLWTLLREAVRLNPEFLEKIKSCSATSRLEFSRKWGLGSSSTLINNIAQWAGVDAFTLLWNGFSGSGYDIACAQHNKPLIYKLKNKVPEIELLEYDPPFRKNLFFVHLNRKQNSREAISHYRKNVANQQGFLTQISEITRAVTTCSELSEFETLLLEHEELLSDALQLQRIQDQLFPDFNGVVKSLGAWGGDFVLATGNENIRSYFNKKGYQTILAYDDLIP